MFVGLLVVTALLLPSAPSQPPAAQPSPPYRPPVDRPVERGFDMSRGPFGAGNRGLDYAVRRGDVVAAIGAGTVVFAGPVAGSVWVTVQHPDGLRSSYGPLTAVTVAAGDRIAGGDPVGSSGPTFHLGVRRGSAYIDPATLFRVRRRHARLVPVRRRTPAIAGR